MTATAADFLREIFAHPQDDAPRLIYADWLDERNQAGDSERAEFIRVQCRIAELMAFVEEWASTPGRREDGGKAGESLAIAQNLQRHEAELLRRLEDEMVADFIAKNLTWRRGFIAEVECNFQQWVRATWRVLGQHPVEKLTVSGISRPSEIGQLQARVHGSSVRELQLIITADFQMLSPKAIQDSLSHRLPGVRVTVQHEATQAAIAAWLYDQDPSSVGST